MVKERRSTLLNEEEHVGKASLPSREDDLQLVRHPIEKPKDRREGSWDAEGMSQLQCLSVGSFKTHGCSSNSGSKKGIQLGGSYSMIPSSHSHVCNYTPPMEAHTVMAAMTEPAAGYRVTLLPFFSLRSRK